MKIIRTLALLYQYVYYWMLEIDHGWLPEITSRYKAYLVFSVLEMLGLGALYTFVARVVLGFPIKQVDIPVAMIVAFVFATFFVNRWLLGFPERVEHYRKIFDSWDKWRRVRWKLYVVMIAVLTVAMS